MSKYAVMPLTDYVGACDKIREKAEITEPIKSAELPSKIDEVYNAGVEVGKSQSQCDLTLYGTYLLKEPINKEEVPISSLDMQFDEKPYMYFYDGINKEYRYLAVNTIYYGADAFSWGSVIENGLTYYLDYVDGYWQYSVYDDVAVSSGNLPDIKGRLVIFTKPTVVSEDFYKLFIAVTDTSEDIFGEGYDKAFGEVEHLNDELETSLYGGDTGYKGYYDEFWDIYQDKGKRTHYVYAFCGFGWNAENFKPKYNIIPEHATGMFNQFAQRIDFASHLESIGIIVDISKAVNADNVFYNSYFTRVGVVDFTGCKKLANAFSYCNYLKTIDKIIVSEECTYNTPFLNCKVLEEVRFEGVIGKNGLNFQYSPLLSKASITNIIEHLSTTTSGLSVTLSKTAVESAFGSTTSAEWTSLISTRSNWTISLV